MAMRPLRDVISAQAALAGLLDRRRRDVALLSRLQELLPPALASQLSAADASRAELVVSAASGAAAALLRQRAPEVLETLAREGWKFTGMRLRVQARPSGAQRSKVYAKQMDEAAAVALRSGAGRIADPVLASAVRRLAEAGRASQDEQQPLERVEDEHAKQQK
jgi:hypothetical protein